MAEIRRAQGVQERMQAPGVAKAQFPSNLIATKSTIDPNMIKSSFNNAIAAWNDPKNHEKYFELFDPSCTVMGLRYMLPPNIDGLKMLFRHLWKSFPDAVYMTEDIVVEGNRACVKFNVQGTHSGEFPPGISATNKRVMINVMTYLIFNEQGKVIYKYLMCDDLDLLTQLGVTDTKLLKAAPEIQRGAQA